MSVLDELVAGALEDQRTRELTVSLEDVKKAALAAPAPIDATRWLKRADGIPVIAEIKRASPSKGHLSDIPDPAALARDIAKKSIPLLLNETLWAAGMALLAQCYSVRGYDVVSAYNICSTVSNVFNVAFMAMGNAVGILVGQLLGAGKMEEAVDTDRKLITFSVVICIVLGGLMSLVAHLFPQIYNTSDSIRDLAAAFIRICALCMPINALANACYFTLRSGGKTFVTFLFDSFYVCVLTVPMAFVLSRFTGLPIVPLFLCCQLADIGKCVVGLIMIRRGVWIQNIVGKEAA